MMARLKKTETETNKSTRVIKQRPIKKPLSKHTAKRVYMQKRRIIALVEEKLSLEEKNRDILDSLNTEKMVNASLRKESFQWQRLYHESTLAINSHRVRENELLQTLSVCIRECDSTFPQLVALSEAVTSNKIRLTNLLNSLRSSDHILPRQFHDMGKEPGLSKKNSNPMKQRVGPMVKGLLITKPKIMLERLMLPQPQGQEPANNDRIPEGNEALPSIAEENDDEGANSEQRNHRLRGTSVPVPSSSTNRERGRLMDTSTQSLETLSPILGFSTPDTSKLHHQLKRIEDLGRSLTNLDLERISVRPRHRLGKSWRMRRQVEKLERERERRNNPVPVAYNETSSDTESNHSDHVEAVVRFKDVSRLLQNSSLLKVEGTHNGDGDSEGSRSKNKTEGQSKNDVHHLPGSAAIQKRPSAEGPSEGSTWMFKGQSKNDVRHLPKPSIEDPLEGSSWMFNNIGGFRSSHNAVKRTSLYKSESSSDEAEIPVSKRNSLNKSSRNTLSMDNETFTVTPMKNRKSLLSKESSSDTLDGSPAEPDSTNNIDHRYTSNSSTVRSSSSSVSVSGLNGSNNRYSVLNNRQSDPLTSINTSSLTVRLSKLLDTSRVTSLDKGCDPAVTNGHSSASSSDPTPTKRQSEFCNNCDPMKDTSEIGEKRIRKPKNMLYPGEEILETQTKRKSSIPPRHSSGKKSKNEKKIVKPKTSVARVSVSTSSVEESNTNNIENNDSASKNAKYETKGTVGGEKKSLAKKRSSVIASRLSNSISNNETNGVSRLSSGKKRNTKTIVGTSVPERKSKLIKRSSVVPSRSSISISSNETSDVASSSGKKRKTKATVATSASARKSKLRKSLPKKSSSNLRNSTDINGRNQSIGSDEGTRPRRNKSQMSYKEATLNTKVRRP